MTMPTYDYMMMATPCPKCNATGVLRRKPCKHCKDGVQAVLRHPASAQDARANILWRYFYESRLVAVCDNGERVELTRNAEAANLREAMREEAQS